MRNSKIFHQSSSKLWLISRRDFLKACALMTAGCRPWPFSHQVSAKGIITRFGIITDTHYADTPTRGTRFFRHSIDKMKQCVELMTEQKVDFLVELGDIKDQDPNPVEAKTISYLQTIEKVLQQFNGPCYHVLGNHDMDSISKSQFLANITNSGLNPGASYYSFDVKGSHFIVLDANFDASGSDYDHGNFDWKDTNITATQMDWLAQDLAATQKPVILFVHQLLDGTGDHYVNNADQLRKILVNSGKVLAVFQGHQHMGQYSCIDSIHYYTLRAMVEGPGRKHNSCAIVAIYSDFNISVTGYYRAESIALLRGL